MKERESKRSRNSQLPYLHNYNRDILGIEPNESESNRVGEYNCTENCIDVAKVNEDLVKVEAMMNGLVLDGKSDTIVKSVMDELISNTAKLHEIDEINKEADGTLWKLGLPPVTELLNGNFGRPSRDHSFTQEASFETTVFQVLKSGYLENKDSSCLGETHPLLQHLWKMMKVYNTIDFTRLREYNWDYAEQSEIPKDRVLMFMACLFHYDLSVANVMRFLGNNYTGGFRNIKEAVAKMQGLVDDDLITEYVRIMTVGAPAHFVADSSRENALLHWRKGNDSSIAENPKFVRKTMNKMDKHNFVIPLMSYMARFIPNIFFTPHHLLLKPGKDPRMICDASRRFTPTSVPINRMTSTHLSVELNCEYGNVLQRLLVRIWNLRVSYPDRDIILHANDVKSCFRQMKHHPDVMGAFSYIIGGYLYLSCGLTMGSDFSPATWEAPRRIIEQLSMALFADKSLRAKHRQYLDQLIWHKKLGRVKQNDLTVAHATKKSPRRHR